MKRLAIALLIVFCGTSAYAQTQVLPYYNIPPTVSGGPIPSVPVDTTHGLPVNVIAGASFTPSLSYTTLTATASSSGSTALPTNTGTVAFQNGTSVAVSCTLASGSATATTNEIIVPAGSTIFVGTTGYDHAACINQTGSASNVIVLAGGSGLGTGFGGGSSGGSSGAVYGPTAGGSAAANPPVQIGGVQTNSNTGLVQPWVINSSGYGLIDAPNGSNLATLVANPLASQSPAVPIGGVSLCDGANGTTNPCTTAATVKAASTASVAADKAIVVNQSPNTGDPCSFANAKLTADFESTTSGGSIITAVSAKKAYICSIFVTNSTATNFSLIEGTGSSVCTGGSPAGIFMNTGVTAANGANLGANSGMAHGGAGNTIAQNGTANYNVCALFTTTNTPQINVHVTYVQQ